MKIALVHDYLVQYGGAERVLECLCEIYPYAPIYTIVYSKELMHGVLEGKNIKTSFLQKFPFSRNRHRIFPQFMPMAIEQFNFSSYDIVLSDSSSFAKGIITGPETLHLCYMHNPMRFAWDDCQKYTEEFYFPSLIKKFVPYLMNYIRVWDRISADRPDAIIANSNFVARRIKKYYKRDCQVINPPVDIHKFTIDPEQKDYFLAVGRLMSYKKFDLVIEAFNKNGLPLKVIGRGPEIKRLKKIAKSNIEFLGRVDDEELKKYYAQCQAIIFPQVEDFGIIPIEAMACGRPIIAFRGGDIPEHVEENKTGIFFEQQTPEAIIEAIKKFQKLTFDSQYIRSRVEKFDREIFKEKIKVFIEKALAEHKKKIGK